MMLGVAAVLAVGSLPFVVASYVRSVPVQRVEGRSVWRELGLGLSLLVLFGGTWLAHGLAQWQAYTDEQRAHDRPIELGDFLADFSQSTLENWQSEFLQLFSFVVLAALYIHKGSAESKDGEQRIEASLRRIEEALGTLPGDATTAAGGWQLPERP